MARRRHSNRRHRRGNSGFLYKLLSVLVICGAVVAALTLFFRVDRIEVTGMERYTEDEVIAASGIDIGDFNTKLRNAQKFLADGNRVKVTVRFRGREMAHTDIGKNLLLDFAQQCAELANLDKEPKLEGRHMSIFLSAKSSKTNK